MDAHGTPTAVGDLEQQMKNAYADLGTILKHHRCTFDDVIVEDVLHDEPSEVSRSLAAPDRTGMKQGIIATPRDPEDVRADFEDFLAALESNPMRKVRVVFGCAWGNELYEGDWLELELTGSELRARVRSAEASGIGRIGDDDLYIEMPELGVERQYCHEADVHVTAADPAHPYLLAERQRWPRRGWDVHSCEVP